MMSTKVNRHRARLITITVITALSFLLMSCIPIIDLFGAGGDKAKVDNVEVIASGDASPTYTAVASGLFPDTCTEMGRMTQRVVRTTVKVTMYTRHVTKAKCIPESVSFEERVRLDVRGLRAGSYSVEVNGAVTSFTLSEDQ